MRNVLIALLLCGMAFGQGLVVKGPAVVAGPMVMSPGTAAAGFTFVGQNSNDCNGAASCAVTYSPANGDLVVLDLTCRDGTASDNPTITTDNGSSTWANAFAAGQQSGSSYFNEDYTLSAAGSPTTITGHCGPSTNDTTVAVTSYHRISGSWVFGTATTQAFGTGTTATSNSITPTGGVPALIHGYIFNSQDSTNTWTTANTTIRLNQAVASGNGIIGAGDQIVALASGSYTASATTGASIAWRAWATTYK